ncbi:hypothetical protein ACLOJK_022901 [Asimina triloba]
MVMGASSQEPSHPSFLPVDVNVEDFLVDPDDNLGGAGPRSGKTDDTEDIVIPVSPSGVPFSTPSTATSRPTMSSTSMPSSSSQL